MLKRYYLSSLIVIFSAILVNGCGLSKTPPDEVALEWMKAVMAANYEGTMELTCNKQEIQDTVGEFMVNTMQGMAFFGEEANEARAREDVARLSFTIVKEGSDVAEVQVKGKARLPKNNPFAVEMWADFDETWLMVLEDSQWKYCGVTTMGSSNAWPQMPWEMR